MHGLELGSLDLVDPIDTDGYAIRVLAEGTTFGSPATVVREIVSMLADGNAVKYDRSGNRVVSFLVEISGADGLALAAGEVALRGELYRPNVVTWTPPGGFGPPTVFEVITSHMEPNFDDLDELRSRRVFQVTLTCAPFARSVDPTVFGALTVGAAASTITVDTCSSITGWTSRQFLWNGTTSGPAFSYAGGTAVASIAAGSGRASQLTLIRTGSVDFTGTPYLVIEADAIGLTPRLWRASADGVPLIPLASNWIVAGRYRVTFEVPASISNASVLTFDLGIIEDGNTASRDFAIHDVSRTNQPPGVSPRQLARIVEVGGTERTPASLHAYSESGFLGRIILHTVPTRTAAGYSPDQRRWRQSGNAAAANVDARKITGLWEPLQPAAVVSRVPHHALPRGGYILMAAMKSDTVATVPISWAVKSVTGGTVIGSVGGEQNWSFGVAHEMHLVTLAADLSLPVVRSDGLDLEVHLLNPSPTVALSVEEWWLFKVDEDCALSIVETFEGHLWLDSPDSNNPVPTVWVGANKPTAFHPGGGLIAQGTHTFPPGDVLVTTISDTNDNVEVELTYHKRWHSNAAE